MPETFDKEIASVLLHSGARVRIAEGTSYQGKYFDVRRMIINPDKSETFTKNGLRLRPEQLEELREKLSEIKL